MEIKIEINPNDIFNDMMDAEEIPMDELVGQLVMNETYTKKTLHKDSVEELKRLIKFIEE